MAEEFDAGISWWARRTTPSSTTTTTSFDDSSSQNPAFDVDWNQSLHARSTSGRAEPSFNAMLQEPLNYHHQQQFQHFGSQDMLISGPQLLGLQGGQSEPQHSIFDPRLMNCDLGSSYHGSSSDSLTKLPQFLKSSSPSTQQSTGGNNLQLAKNAAFWPSSLPVQFAARSHEQKPNCGSITTKLNLDGAPKKISSCGGDGSGRESALKKARIGTPSPLPAFKVRKEKLGDRVTALQQLVSPFGKPDTASVLHEANEYIKFLHEQVSALTNPYLKNGPPMQGEERSNKSKDQEGQKQDLRSIGLCLVPIGNTYPVASETAADFWAPTFGGTYRKRR